MSSQDLKDRAAIAPGESGPDVAVARRPVPGRRHRSPDAQQALVRAALDAVFSAAAVFAIIAVVAIDTIHSRAPDCPSSPRRLGCGTARILLGGGFALIAAGAVLWQRSAGLRRSAAVHSAIEPGPPPPTVATPTVSPAQVGFLRPA